MVSFTLVTSLKALFPNTITLGLKLQHMNFGEGKRIQSTARFAEGSRIVLLVWGS